MSLEEYSQIGNASRASAINSAYVNRLNSELVKLKESICAAAETFGGEFEALVGNSNADTPEKTISEMVDNLFAVWKRLPDPSFYLAMKSDIDSSLEPLEGAQNIAMSDIADGSASKQLSGGTGMRIIDYAAEVTANIDGWRGKTVNNFRNTYCSRFNSIHATQFELGSILSLICEAERTIWSESQRAVLELVEQATIAFDELDCFGGPDNVKIFLNVLTAVASVISAPLSGGFLVFATVVTQVFAFMPVGEKVDSSYDLDGSTIEGLWAQITAALVMIRKDIIESERVLSQCMDNVFKELANQLPIGMAGNGDRIFADVMDILRPPSPGQLNDVEPPRASFNPQ